MQSDRELTAQVAAGDRDSALAMLIERHGVMLERTIRRLVKDPHLSDDVCQAVLIVLVKKAGALTAEGSLGGWLHRTAVLAARDALRQEARRKRREEEAARRMMQTRDEPAPLLPDGFDEALERLPAVYREALVMRYLEGRSRMEIADALKLNEGAVDTRISRGVDRLRKVLAGTAGAVAAGVLTQALSAEAAAASSIEISVAMGAVLTAVSTGNPGAGAVTAAKGAMQTMLWIKVKTAAALAAAVVCLGAGTVHWVRAEEPPAKDAALIASKPAEIKFEDVSAKAGIQRERAPKLKGKDETDLAALKDGADYYDWPFDVFCGDIDGDGHADVFSSDHHAGGRTPGGIWLGKGDGTFTGNILLRTPIEDTVKKDGKTGIGAGMGVVLDVNGDGKMDFICSEGRGLYLNEGTVGEGENRGVKFKLYKWGGARGWTFNDFNRDGNLDVATGWGSAVCFGGGKDTQPAQWKASAQAAEEIKKWEDPFHHCISADFRRCGSADILGGQAIWRWAWGGAEKKAERKEPRGILMVNDGKGNFTESAEAYGLAEMSSTGPLVAADFNNDGFFDIFSEGLGNPDSPAKARFFYNEEGRKFTLKDPAAMGIQIKLPVTGIALQYCCASAVDLDNDGLLDLVVGQDPDGKIRMFRNLGNFQFHETTALPSKGGHEARFAVADFNEDGLPDLALNGGPCGLEIYLNRTTNENGWLEVSVKGKAGNVLGVGALVELFQPGKLGDRAAYFGMQPVVAENQNHVPLTPHFGLGRNATTDVRVTLPTGEVLEARGVSAKTRLTADFEAHSFAPRKP